MAPRHHDLARLIDEVKRDQTMSDEDIAHRARRAGHQISKQHIANVRAQDPLKSIVPSTMRALAAGLELPLGRVVGAALASGGLPSGAPVDWSIQAAIAHDPELPLAAKRILRSVLDSTREPDVQAEPGATVHPLDQPRATPAREADPQPEHSAKVRALEPPQTAKNAARKRVKKDT